MTSCQYKLQNRESTDSSNNVKERYMFVVEWYDPVAQIIKKFLMTYHSLDQTVELVSDFPIICLHSGKLKFTSKIGNTEVWYDLKNHRVFLRRCKQEGIELDNLYKSAIVTIMSRQIKIVDYADVHTKCKFEVELSHTFCMVKPDAIEKVGEIITFMNDNGLKIISAKMGHMTNECAGEFYKEHQGKSFFPGLISFMSSSPSIALSVIGQDAVKRWRDFIGPMDSEEAKRIAPQSLRAIYGTDVTRNGVHGSKDEEHVTWETEIWFPKSLSSEKMDYIKPTCVAKNTTCCIVKPHAVLEGTLGPIISFIYRKEFKVTALEMFTLDVSSAEEFLEVYKGVVPEYSAMVVQLTSGPCVVMEIMDIKNPECSQENFRKIAGPTDPEIAQKLRPDTIRAKFGKTKVLNAVHCTDLPDDAILEVEYFFKVLQI